LKKGKEYKIARNGMDLKMHMDLIRENTHGHSTTRLLDMGEKVWISIIGHRRFAGRKRLSEYDQRGIKQEVFPESHLFFVQPINISCAKYLGNTFASSPILNCLTSHLFSLSLILFRLLFCVTSLLMRVHVKCNLDSSELLDY